MSLEESFIHYTSGMDPTFVGKDHFKIEKPKMFNTSVKTTRSKSHLNATIINKSQLKSNKIRKSEKICNNHGRISQINALNH